MGSFAPPERAEDAPIMSLLCSQCQAFIFVDPVSGHVPPWCSRCGADRKVYMQQTAAATLPATATATTGDAATGDGAAVVPGQVGGLPSPQIVPYHFAQVMTEPKPVRRSKCGGYVLGIAALFLAGFAYQSYTACTKLNTFARVEGEVIDLDTSQGSHARPVVAYEVNGQTHRLQSQGSIGSLAAEYQIGDTVEVLYPPNRPGEGTINSFSDLWLSAVGLGLPGFALLAVWFYFVRHVGRSPVYAPRSV
jgi:hypothetical protein